MVFMPFPKENKLAGKMELDSYHQSSLVLNIHTYIFKNFAKRGRESNWMERGVGVGFRNGD